MNRQATGHDPIALQLLWTRLEAIAEEGVLAIQRTAISPAVAEAKDCTCTIVDAQGGLLVGGGALGFHFGAACTAVRAIIDRHGASIADGDVFFGNDPHSDIAIHNQDVMIARPVFSGETMVAWAVASAHMIDMGGLQFGSFSPLATECYQEAIRLPPVRLFRQGEEQRDIWDILRNNIRVPDLVEMDMRALIAGCHVAAEKLVELVGELGDASRFATLADGMNALLDAELERRFLQLTAGRYRATGWSEWETELYELPCELTVADGHLHFDFTGVPPQCSHYLNSRPWIVKANLVPHIQNLLAADLPFAHAIYDRIEVDCPPGTILNCTPPAPNAASHMDVGGNAAAVALNTLILALAASEEAAAHERLSAVMPLCNHAMQTWSFNDRKGRPDGFLVIDGSSMGGAAALDHDGTDLTFFTYGKHAPLELIATEIYEDWYPVLVTEKRLRPGAGGAGRFRSGAGLEMGFRPHGVDKLTGLMIATREHLPTAGMAGGEPGPLTQITIRTADGQSHRVSAQASRVEVHAGEEFHFRMSSAGGYGDPLDRDPGEVLEDVLCGRLDAAAAEATYGVVLQGREIDQAATSRRRSALLLERLEQAEPALRAHSGQQTAPLEATLPLYPGVVQVGSLAVSSRSGAILAEAPACWTGGCPTLTTRWTSAAGPMVKVVYLDPATGHALATDARPAANESASFSSAPDRWRNVRVQKGERG